MMRRNHSRASAGKYPLLVLFVGLFVAWYVWKQSYGNIGPVAHLTGSTRDHIAFLRTDENGACNLYIVRSDGTGMRALTNNDAPKRMPAWSPDGRRLCFAQESRTEGAATYQLYVLGEGAPRQVTYGSISKDMPRWRPDGGLIAFLSGGAIKVVTPNGSDVEQIYPRPHRGGGATDESGDAQPTAEDAGGLRRPPIASYRWAPVGASVVGVQVMEGENAAVLGQSSWWAQPGAEEAPSVPAGVVEPESLVVLSHLEAEPFMLPGAETVMFDWYPDGRRVLASLATRQGRHALVRFRTDEKNLPVEPVLTADTLTMGAEHPAVSPDGRTVAFELWRLESGENRTLLGIGAVPADAQSPVVIRKAADVAKIRLLVAGDARAPQWSPDGSKLLYTMVRPDGRTDLYVVAVSGSKAVNLTRGVGDNSDAAWSPARR